MRIPILSILLISSVFASAQIQPYQVRGNTPKDILWILGTDTVAASGKYGLGKWYNLDSLDFSSCHAIDEFLIEEDGSLTLINCDGDTVTFTAGGDTDWYKLNTTAIPNNTDSMERSGYTLLNGLNGGLPTKIEMLKEGYIQFRNDSFYEFSRYLLKGLPHQTGVGTPPIGLTTGTFDNVYGTRNNQTLAFGINPSSLDTDNNGLYLSFEDYYRPDATNAYKEHHLIFRDSSDLEHRVFSYTLNENLSGWNVYSTVDSWSLKHVADDELYGRITWDGGENTSLRLNGTDSGEGIQFNLNTAINALILNGIDGLGANSVFWSNLDATYANRMRVINDWGTFQGSDGIATQIWGSEAVVGGGMVKMDAAYGVNINASGDLEVDTTQLATQYDLTLIDGTDGNGIFDAANEGATTAVVIANVPDDGFYFQDLDGTGFIGYEPGTNGVNIVDYDDRPALTVSNLGAFEARIDIDNEVTIGTNVAGDFLLTDLGSSIIPLKIENATTVNNTVKLEADGDVMIADYPSSRDDAGSPTNLLSTDGTGVIQSNPAGETVQDITGAMFSGNTETGISITYDDSDGTIDAVASDVSNTNELQTLTIDSSGASAPRTITIGITDGNEVTFLDLEGAGGSDQTLDVSGTGPIVTLDLSADASDPTLTGSGAAAVTASGNAITIGVSQEAIQDYIGPMVDPGNTETGITVTYDDAGNMFDFVVTDASATNELTTVKVDNAAVSTGAVTLDFASADFGVAESPTDEFQLTIQPERIQDIVGAMFTSNTETGVSVDYQDADGTIDVVVSAGTLTAQEDDVNSETPVTTIDIGDGFDWNPSTGGEVDLQYDFSEFPTDGTTEGDELVVVYDPSGTNPELVALSGLGGGNSIYVGDGTVPSDVDAAVTDSLEFGPGIVKIINSTNDAVGIGAEAPAGTLHVRSTSVGVYPEFIIESLSETVEHQTKSISDGSQPPYKITVQNKDLNIDLTGDYYKTHEISFTKASSTLPGGAISFSIGYDSVNVDQVLTINSRPTGSTDGYVGIVGGLRYKWTTNNTTSITLNLGDYGLTTTSASAKTVTMPDAVSGIIGQFFMIYNSGSGAATIVGGAGDTIHGTPTVNQFESVQVHCPAADVWIITN